ncbi:MAG: prolyl oligopeptidase family serine peptidase [Gammaproteobacteria bacterium]|nr:prolyl oligopeptidase family serine peptidase [Gammaproteobacteria bacterium]
MSIRQLIASMILFLSHQVLAEQLTLSVEHEGDSRPYLLYMPSHINPQEPVPLVLILHGRGGGTQRMADLSDFNTRADHGGFIVAYPQAIDQQWNYLHGIAGYRESPNDSDYLLKIIDAIQTTQNIDSRRIYITGLSNGGFMTQRLACYAPQRFAGFASVAASGYAGMSIDCQHQSAVSMLYIHGTADSKVPWNGLSIQDANGNQQAVTMSMSESLKFWSERNQCSSRVNSRNLPEAGQSPGTRVRVYESTGCNANAQVSLYAVFNGGHNWPGVTDFIPPEIAGRVNLDIHASDVIWSFFRERKLP